MKKSAKAREGVCKLTLRPGRFVDSHLIPAALTRLSRTGKKYVETGIGHETKHRSNSWYDGELVTREGEDILADIDAKGIELLRKHRLVWSGWGDVDSIADEFADETGDRQGWRAVFIEHTQDLQLFFLSLLWRAAATKRPEFDDVSLPASVEEELRVRVLKGKPGALSDFPVQLFQLTTRGVEHNRTPLLESKRVPHPSGTGWVGRADYVRFYFDGLVAHVHLPGQMHLSAEYLSACLGMADQGATIVFGHAFSDSRASDNIKEMRETVLRQELEPPFAKRATAAAAAGHVSSSKTY